MPERYFVFIFWSANPSISARTRKRKYFDPCTWAYTCVKTARFHGGIQIIVYSLVLVPASRPFSRWKRNYCAVLVLTLVLASLVKTRLKAGSTWEPYFGWVLCFDANISFTFQSIKNLSAHPTYLCFGPFCKFFGDFLVYLEINSFSQRISKIYGNREFWRFRVVLNWKFEVQNW